MLKPATWIMVSWEEPAAKGAIVGEICEAEKTSDEKAIVGFGTSGWRGEIDSEFTLKNVQVVVEAIVKIYKEYFVKKGTIDFVAIDELLKSGRITVVTDHVHGATRGRPDYILGNPECLITLRTEDNVLFGGIAPEPSSKNLIHAKEAFAKADTEFKLGVIFDPDGDRILFYDGEKEIDMTRFGAMVLHYFETICGMEVCVAK